jgi:hypothetical protein
MYQVRPFLFSFVESLAYIESASWDVKPLNCASSVRVMVGLFAAGFGAGLAGNVCGFADCSA